VGKNKWQTGVFENIREPWEEFKCAKAILIDIPIGLKEERVDERECDVEARRLLRSKRASSVFRSPCRKAIYSPRFWQLLPSLVLANLRPFQKAPSRTQRGYL
jgi:predicted RNase H-like nuclease